MSRARKNKGKPLELTASSIGGVVRDVDIKRGQSRRLTLAEARRKALEDSENAEKAQIEYAEDEARRWYDYKVMELVDDKSMAPLSSIEHNGFRNANSSFLLFSKIIWQAQKLAITEK